MSTGIEWTDETWNPVTGCTKVSPGCDHCYAETIAHRFAGTKAFPNGFDVTLHPDRLGQPLRWRKPRRVFVNSMSDLFHDQVPGEYIAKVFAVMAMTPRHTYQILTKRHARMRVLLKRDDFWREVRASVTRDLDRIAEAVGLVRNPLPNVLLGTSVETQQWADIRVPALLDTPAAVRFLSCEPLLGPVSFRWANWAPVVNANHLDGLKGIDWVIVGGESGPGARPMHPDWARALRDQCTAAGVPFFFKQWGQWAPGEIPGQIDVLLNAESGQGTYEAHRSRPGNERMSRVGKKAAGRELDGRVWDEYPQAVTQ